MKVKCIAITANNFPDDALDLKNGLTKVSEFNLLLGKEYIVYAMTILGGYMWYFICDESYSYYPVWNHSLLFEIVDCSISRYWKYNFIRGNQTWPNSKAILAFDEWASDPYNYYDRLTDGEDNEVEIFKRYKELMDLEFLDLSISFQAKDLGNNWLMCVKCDEAWELAEHNGMLRCPKCRTIQRNPIYPALSGFRNT